MVNDPLIAQAIFASYFLLIIGLFVLILRSQSHKFRTAFTFKDPDVVLFTFLTLGSFAHTWFCESIRTSLPRLDVSDPLDYQDMFKFMAVRSSPIYLKDRSPLNQLSPVEFREL